MDFNSEELDHYLDELKIYNDFIKQRNEINKKVNTAKEKVDEALKEFKNRSDVLFFDLKYLFWDIRKLDSNELADEATRIIKKYGGEPAEKFDLFEQGSFDYISSSYKNNKIYLSIVQYGICETEEYVFAEIKLKDYHSLAEEMKNLSITVEALCEELKKKEEKEKEEKEDQMYLKLKEKFESKI